MAIIYTCNFSNLSRVDMIVTPRLRVDPTYAQPAEPAPNSYTYVYAGTQRSICTRVPDPHALLELELIVQFSVPTTVRVASSFTSDKMFHIRDCGHPLAFALPLSDEKSWITLNSIPSAAYCTDVNGLQLKHGDRVLYMKDVEPLLGRMSYTTGISMQDVTDLRFVPAEDFQPLCMLYGPGEDIMLD